MTACFLRVGNDYLEDAQRFPSIQDACDEYLDCARDLDRFGQAIEASIHIADHIDEVAEYPDFVLSLGPRGGLIKERA